MIDPIVERICKGIGQAYRATVDCKFTKILGPTINDPAMTEICQEAARKACGDDCLVDFGAVTGGEDFSSYRIQFASDGGLTLSSRSGENDWTPMGAGEDYFRIYDDFLALTLYDNPVFGTPAKWDVKCFRIDSISDSTATMSLRSAGESFTLSYISSN